MIRPNDSILLVRAPKLLIRVSSSLASKGVYGQRPVGFRNALVQLPSLDATLNTITRQSFPPQPRRTIGPMALSSLP
ncbi:hypothetical protein AFLA_001360 [Aspergillus flavus NRRL3357]|nr:hypothetical protein AFLA_001360 [Aspergillus flavus NRRL3357]